MTSVKNRHGFVFFYGLPVQNWVTLERQGGAKRRTAERLSTNFLSFCRFTFPLSPFLSYLSFTLFLIIIPIYFFMSFIDFIYFCLVCIPVILSYNTTFVFAFLSVWRFTLFSIIHFIQ